MLALFLGGLLIAIAAATVIVLVKITVSWLKSEVTTRIEARKNHKIVFADTTEVVDSYIKEEIGKKDGISMSDLRRMCEDAPYVIAEIDRETNEISHYQTYKAEEIDSGIAAKVKNGDGIVVIG